MFCINSFKGNIIVVSHEDAAQLPQLKESVSTAIHIRPHTIGAMLFRACLRARGGVRAAYERLLDHFFRTDRGETDGPEDPQDGPEDQQDLPDLLTPSSLAQPEERRLRAVARSSAPPTLLPGKGAADDSPFPDATLPAEGRARRRSDIGVRIAPPRPRPLRCMGPQDGTPAMDEQT